MFAFLCRHQWYVLQGDTSYNTPRRLGIQKQRQRIMIYYCIKSLFLLCVRFHRKRPYTEYYCIHLTFVYFIFHKFKVVLIYTHRHHTSLCYGSQGIVHIIQHSCDARAQSGSDSQAPLDFTVLWHGILHHIMRLLCDVVRPYTEKFCF